MTDTSMIEKVARALRDDFKLRISESAGEPFEATGVSVPADDVWARYARAAIAAMREPTGYMPHAGGMALANTGLSDSPIGGMSMRAPIECWQAMIDEALKD